MAVARVEALRDVTRELQVLTLILAHGHAVGEVEQDVRGLQFSSQASSACSRTWLCTNTIARWGSRPAATSVANVSRVELVSSDGSNGCVIECRSTTQKIDSAP